MMAGQCAMILAPVVMGQLSKVKDFVPFYTTVVGGSIVVLAMLFILSRPGGAKAGRMSKEEWGVCVDVPVDVDVPVEMEMEEKEGGNEVDVDVKKGGNESVPVCVEMEMEEKECVDVENKRENTME